MSAVVGPAVLSRRVFLSPGGAVIVERRAIAIEGVVQGVGFRPFVYRLAARLDLRGFVQNRVGGVWIEVEGEPCTLDHFLTELATKPPPLARIADLTWERRPVQGDRPFRIEASDGGEAGPVFISPDVATCDDCLRELFDPADRRYLYPFLNCTNCGPRLTIVTGAPYDRERTTMAPFLMCAGCQAEYDDPTNRRFHAQPTCCPLCGPRLQILDGQGQSLAGEPLDRFVAELKSGKIGALKGLGGYHLVCDARSESTVAELRRRKKRDEKPFALMVRDENAVEALCESDPEVLALLRSSRRPIVLLRKRADAPVAPAVAPANPSLGVMLPYTPLHYLLLRAYGDTPLVMTSGNRSDEPIAYEDAEAIQRLAGIADVFLTHDRPIHVRCEDSVTRTVAGVELPVRRSRGYAPQPVPLSQECTSPILAVGGQLKGTFALGRGCQAFLSHHLGDLDHFEAYRAFVQDVALYEQLLGVRPKVIAHDLHPDYASTRYARKRAQAEGIRLVAVQHHHAHMASVMAENGLTEPLIGVSFDGTGYGTDGTIWGGEFLVGDLRGFRREAHLRYVGLPGGDRAVREPWRVALAHLVDSGVSDDLLAQRVPAEEMRIIRAMLARRLNTPLTSSAGRLFDAVAALAGVRDRVSFEGQAAMELEWQATEVFPDWSYPFALEEPAEAPICIDTRPLIAAVAEDVSRGASSAQVGRRFHSTVVQLISAVCGRVRRDTGLGIVVLSGGVFMNALLTEEVTAHLQEEGFRVHRHRLVPPNDGGLSLGQVAVAAALARQAI